MMRIVTCVAAAAVVAGCSQPVAEPVAPPVATVRTVEVQERMLEETITAYGQVEFNPAGVRALSATFEAEVGQVHASVGEAVVTGQPIATLTASPTTRLELDRLAREARVATAEHERLQRLRVDGLASDSEVASAGAAAATAVESSENLQRLTEGGTVTLKAPAAGVIDSLSVSPGALVGVGGSVARIGSTRLLNARLGIEVEDAQRIPPHAAIRLTGLHEAGAVVESRVASIDRRVEPGTRLAAVIVSLPPGSPLLPGEALRSDIVVRALPRATVVSRAAVLYDGDQAYVFVVRGGVASRRSVTVGLEQAGLVQVTSGVQAGERVVTEGGPALSDGMAVREAATPAAAAP